MARVKFGFGITSISGKVGGCVFRSGEGTPTLQTKSPGRMISAGAWNDVQTKVAVVNNEWSKLTDDQRAVWSAYSNFSPTRTKHSQDYFITGRQIFIKYNLYRLYYQYSVLTDPIFSTSDLDPITFSVELDGGDIKLVSDRIADPTYEFFALHVTSPTRATINNAGSRYRMMYIKTLTTDEFIFTSEYIRHFGIVPSSGSTIFFKATNIHQQFPAFGAWQKRKTVL